MVVVATTIMAEAVGAPVVLAVVVVVDRLS